MLRKSHRLFLFFLLLLLPVVLAQSDSAATNIVNDNPTKSNSAVADVTGSVQAGDDGACLYPMDEKRKANLIAYSRFKNIWRFAKFFIGLGVFALLLFTGLSARFRNWANVARKRFFVVWLYLIFVLIADYLLNLPFHIYRGFVIESDYGFINQTFLQWWEEDLFNLLITAAVGIIPMWFFYGAISRFRKWWLAFSLGAIPFAVFFIVITPIFIAPLFNDYEPVKDKVLETKLLNLAATVGIEDPDVFQVNASKQSSKINAYVTGMFGSKRIVLYDTMIDNFTHDEILFVMGHEMGHYVKHHIWWGLAVAIGFIMFAFWLTSISIHWFINRFKQKFQFDNLSDIASLPLVLAYLSVISFVFQPVSNSISRYMERTCDEYGMTVTEVSGESAAIAFDKLSVLNLSDPDPHPLIEFWFYNHPALEKRMKYVRSYHR